MPFSETTTSPSDGAGKDHLTHALLLGFKNSHLTQQITGLEYVMSSKLGWKTSLYWIDGPDSKTAQERLDNVAYSLRSNFQHPDERIVIYYGGNALHHDDPMSSWPTDCGITWHAATKPSRNSVCGECELRVDPSVLLSTVLKQPCDLLLLTDSRSDLCWSTFEQWTQKTALRPSTRERNVHFVAFGDAPAKRTDKSVTACKDCGSPAVLPFDAEETAEETKALGEALLSTVSATPTLQSDVKAGVNVGSRPKLGGKFNVTAVIQYRDFTLPPLLPIVQPTSNTNPRYTSTNVLLLGWDHSAGPWRMGEEQFSTSAMQEAFKAFNYGVEIASVPEDADSDGAWPGHDGWIGSTLHKFVQEHGGAGKLVVVYYNGHGSVSASGASHLEAWRTGSGGPNFDLTRLQALLRDRCAGDVLLVLDCCYAGFVPDRFDLAYRHAVNRPDHIMETIAACPSRSTTSAMPPHNFSRRLAGQLILHAGRAGGLSVDELNSLLVHDWRYREYASGEEKDSKENVRILNCGRESIVLERMPDKGGDEGGAEAQKAGEKAKEKPVDGHEKTEEAERKDAVLGLDEKSLGDRRLDVQRELADRSGTQTK